MVKYNLTKVDWNNEYNWEMDILNEIIDHYNQHGNLHIVLNGDGMDVSKSGLHKVLQFMKNNYTSTDIIIENSNLLESDLYTDIYNLNTQFINQCNHKIDLDKQIQHKFCMFYGRPTWYRLILASWLNETNSKAPLSYHGSTDLYPNFNGTENQSIGVEFDTLCKRSIININISRVLNLINLLPKQINNQVSGNDTANNPLLLAPEYESAFIEVIAETAIAGKVFFPTEKTYRPIMFRTPFLCYGPRNYLKNLRKLGFETFHQFWNEGYDNIEDDNYRITVLIEELDVMNNKSLEELKQMYLDMKPILDHNYNVLMNLTKADFNRERFK